MIHYRAKAPLLAALATLILNGCAIFAPPPAPPTQPPTPPAQPKPEPLYVWDSEKAKTAKGPTAILISLSEQRAFLYKGEELIGESRISSGKRGFETPPGEYKVIQKNANHVSNLYGKILDPKGAIFKSDADMSKMKLPVGHTFVGAKMPYFMRFHGGYGLHAGHVPKYPASHGCVRLPRIMAQRFFQHTAMGSPVTVEE